MAIATSGGLAGSVDGAAVGGAMAADDAGSVSPPDRGAAAPEAPTAGMPGLSDGGEAIGEAMAAGQRRPSHGWRCGGRGSAIAGDAGSTGDGATVGAVIAAAASGSVDGNAAIGESMATGDAGSTDDGTTVGAVMAAGDPGSVDGIAAIGKSIAGGGTGSTNDGAPGGAALAANDSGRVDGGVAIGESIAAGDAGSTDTGLAVGGAMAGIGGVSIALMFHEVTAIPTTRSDTKAAIGTTTNTLAVLSNTLAVLSNMPNRQERAGCDQRGCQFYAMPRAAREYRRAGRGIDIELQAQKKFVRSIGEPMLQADACYRGKLGGALQWLPTDEMLKPPITWTWRSGG